VRRRIDAARQPADDHQAARRQVARQPLRDGEAIRRRGPRADDRHDRRVDEHRRVAAQPEERRRIGNRRQRRRIGRIVPGQRREARLRAPLDRARRARRHLRRTPGVGVAAPPREPLEERTGRVPGAEPFGDMAGPGDREERQRRERGEIRGRRGHGSPGFRCEPDLLRL